jgi:hypothetical protein
MRYAGINIGIIFFSIGILAMCYLITRDIPLIRNGVTTEGTVIQIYTKHNPSYRRLPGITYDIPIISFTTPDHKEFQTWGCPDCYKIGDRVPIIYDPKNPANAEVNSWRLATEPVYYLVGFTVFLIVFVRIKKKLNIRNASTTFSQSRTS